MGLLARLLRQDQRGQSEFPDEAALIGEIARLRGAYLELTKGCVLGTIYRDPGVHAKESAGDPEFKAEWREFGHDVPFRAHTMIGNRRIVNLWQVCEDVIVNHVPGDFIETGVWRGGSCIFMRALLKTYGIKDRTVWVADSFEGLPPPNEEKYPADQGLNLHLVPELAVSMEEVRGNFESYGLLDEQVRFLKGWFKDTLAAAPIERLAVLRLDGDLYESTMDALRALYHKLSPGGYVIVDDFESLVACKRAIEDFRRENGIDEPIYGIDGTGVFWQKRSA